MNQDDTKRRPTMGDVAEWFSQTVKHLSKRGLISRASAVYEIRVDRIVRNARYWIWSVRAPDLSA
ncbi:hypothetical protein BDQ17DRAFT_492411 [Cyathus striatus]|nr:hypothetical protein BDQ17DRAFT_492411 [Cyathus striatus]